MSGRGQGGPRGLSSDRLEAATLMRAFIEASQIGMRQMQAHRVLDIKPFWDPLAVVRLSVDASPFEGAMLQLYLAGLHVPGIDVRRGLGDDVTTLFLKEGLLKAADDGTLFSPYLLVSHLNRHVLAAAPLGHPRFRIETQPYCGPESLWYAQHVAMRGPYASCLDLCTGSGLIAMLPKAGRVTAVEIDERACDVAAFNVAMNMCGEIEVRCGDLFDPVAGTRFGLITANPPFLPSAPNGRLPQCGDGGRRGDEIVARILLGVPERLEDGGEALIYAEGFGDDLGPAVLERLGGGTISPEHDYTCWISAVRNGERVRADLFRLWQAVGVIEDEAWDRWRSLGEDMPTSHYHNVLWRVGPGRGVARSRRMSPS